MSIAVATVGDTFEGNCSRCDDSPKVTGTITTGEFLQINGKNVAVDGSVCVASCGHSGMLKATATVLKVNGKPVGRLGDSVDGFSNSKITSASDVLFAD